jgi:lipopolysaccharide transport protein LptA
MKLITLVMLPSLLASIVFAQTSVSSAVQTSKPAATNSPKKKQTEEPTKDLFGTESKIEGPITTEIYADEAFFDSNKNVGVFTGHVKVLDPRFSLQSDKLTVYLRKGQDQGLERAVADGNVGVVRERPDPNSGQPTRAVGRSDHAVYTASDGNVELTGTPRVQQGPNMHVATSADTVMFINQSGQLTTHGPSRTEIHQEAKEEKPAAQPKE